MKPFRYTTLCILCICFLFFACKTKNYRKNIKVKNGVESDISPNSISIYTPQFTWADGKFSAKIIQDGTKHNVTGRIKIKKDSIAWLQIKGAEIIEVARALCTPDSIFFLNMLQKQYFTGNYQFIHQKWNIDVNFKMLQAILTASPYYFEKNRYQVYISQNDTIIANQNPEDYNQLRSNGLYPTTLFHLLEIKNGFLKKVIVFYPSNQVTLELQIKKRVKQEEQWMPEILQATIISKTSTVNFDLDFREWKLNESSSTPLRIPKSYSPMQ